MTRTYKVNVNSYDKFGGYSTLFFIHKKSNLAFKEYITKSRAKYARKVQKKLSKYNLAPAVYSDICKIKFHKLPGRKTGWGYITEIADTINDNEHDYLEEIQNLIDDIYEKIGLKFWDCHYSNIGFIVRNDKRKLVCIDTGQESFDEYNNAWGNMHPGPFCYCCSSFRCVCEKE